MMFEKDFVECIIGLFVIVSLILCCMMIFDNDNTNTYMPMNTTEHIIDMKITYINDFAEHRNHYFVFTENYCYDIPLSEYSKLHKGDVVNITIYNEYSSGLILGNHSYGDV